MRTTTGHILPVPPISQPSFDFWPRLENAQHWQPLYSPATSNPLQALGGGVGPALAVRTSTGARSAIRHFYIASTRGMPVLYYPHW